MSNKRFLPIGKTELEVLHIVWELKEATVNDVLEQILKKRKVAYTTIMTVMKNLSGKGVLKYRKEGTTYVYSAKQSQQPEEVQGKLLSEILDKVFKGSPSALIQTLVKHENLSKEDREEIKKLIDGMED
ncbi:MAG: BlaI/MecI/CopY family transcriptional regulator [Balneolaceae bacterium]|nr:BlaI/MecI/CopY family transcriptional regulator [Balneolaceae bacterium]MBO6544886.1 BlaI/MecI/CopY family transcriptional regulator [Balneolaceae bacterium]MBO6646282.1 BlaI/MecI/CopY family transcriptional regulator [Balneolaceae bacterium]